MLLKKISKISGIRPKELLMSPIGLLCYLMDCMQQGYTLEDAIYKSYTYELSALSIQEVLYNTELLKRIESIKGNVSDIRILPGILAGRY